MAQRIALETLDGAKEPVGSFAPCAFAAGETGEAPACSAGLVLATSLAQFASESGRGVCDTGHYQMPYRVWGQGPALIIIPGLCDDPETFALPMARLSRQFCCITYELPTGRGDGSRLSTHSHADLVDDLFALMKQLRIESAILMGVSFGSTIALAALARAPKRFTIGIVQGGFAKQSLAWTELLAARFARYWSGSISRLPMWLPVIERMVGTEFQAVEPARWPFLLEHYGRVAMAAVAHRMLLLSQLDLRPLLPTISQPVLMICGEHDRVVSRAIDEELRSGLPTVARAEIEGCGHLPHFTHPEVLCEVIEQFLGMKERTPGPV